jgi:arylsulfatase A-like enzyme
VVVVVHATQEKKNRRPNFILLFMDDLGYGDLGFTGHPTTSTPNLDQLAWHGKILTTWYSGCNVCTGSRAALMTGRQFPRTGLPGVLGSTTNLGLPLNETTIAEHLRHGAGYATAIVGKWHLGQRPVYLPGNRGFDYYLGIPYSDDMGNGVASTCPAWMEEDDKSSTMNANIPSRTDGDDDTTREASMWSKELYQAKGFLQAASTTINKDSNTNAQYVLNDDDPAGRHLPLVYQEFNKTQIVEQPLDFTTLAQKYNDFAMRFIEQQHQKESPFFLYMPFSHVHTTSQTQPEKQYAGCDFQNSTARGAFGDALAEADWIVGNIVLKLKELNLDEDTLILFTSDNGPWMQQGLSGGSAGLFTGRHAGYWNTGKGSTWEGGIRMPAFARWRGKIEPFGRSSEIISSLDVFPTLSALAGLSLPPNRTFDGKDMSDVLLGKGKSKHDFLFFYNTCSGDPYWSVSSVRHGKYKAHWCTAPGLGSEFYNHSHVAKYDPPLLFNIEKDPSEAEPINKDNELPDDPNDLAAIQRILKAYAMEKATFEFGNLVPYPDGPGEGPDRYGLCCDRSKNCFCIDDTDDEEEKTNVGIFNLGTKQHHDKYHEALGEKEPSPPRTRAQIMMLQNHANIME